MGTPVGNYGSLDDLQDEAPSQIPAPVDSGGMSSSTTAAAAVSWGAEGSPAVSMAGEYINVNDSIQFTAFNSNAALTSLTAQLRIMLPDGTIQITPLTIGSLSADRTANVASLSQVEGFLLAVVVGPPSAATVRGQTYVTVNIVRGAAPTLLTTLQLVADYVTTSFLPSWPGGELKSSVDGPGALLAYQSTLPTHGANPLIDSPAGVVWRIISASVPLTTDGVAGNRTVQLSVSIAGGSPLTMQMPFAQPASETVTYTWGSGVPFSPAASTGQAAPLPVDFRLAAPIEVKTITGGLDTNDQYNKLSLLVEEWINV